MDRASREEGSRVGREQSQEYLTTSIFSDRHLTTLCQLGDLGALTGPVPTSSTKYNYNNSVHYRALAVYQTLLRVLYVDLILLTTYN